MNNTIPEVFLSQFCGVVTKTRGKGTERRIRTWGQKDDFSLGHVNFKMPLRPLRGELAVKTSGSLEGISIFVVIVGESEGHSLNPKGCHETDGRMTHSQRLRCCDTSTSNSPELSSLPGAAEQFGSMVKCVP